MRWLGLRSSDIGLIPAEATQELTDRDLSLAKGLLTKLEVSHCPPRHLSWLPSYHGRV